MENSDAIKMKPCMHFSKAQNSSDATVIDAAVAAIKYCMIKYKKEMYGVCFPNEIWNAFCV